MSARMTTVAHEYPLCVCGHTVIDHDLRLTSSCGEVSPIVLGADPRWDYQGLATPCLKCHCLQVRRLAVFESVPQFGEQVSRSK